MQAIKSLVVLALPFLVVATPLTTRTDGPACNTGSLQCCNKTVNSSNPGATSLLGLLGIVATLTDLVGIECSPLSVVGIGANNCEQNTVCCTGNNFNGLVVLGCSPLNANL